MSNQNIKELIDQYHQQDIDRFSSKKRIDKFLRSYHKQNNNRILRLALAEKNKNIELSSSVDFETDPFMYVGLAATISIIFCYFYI